MTTSELVQKFRDSVTPILLEQDDFIDWSAVGSALRRSEQAIDHLEEIRATGLVDVDHLAAALERFPDIYDVSLSLVAFNTSGSQVTKWGLAAEAPTSDISRRFVASQLLHVGLDKVLNCSAPVRDLLRIAEVYKDSFRRRFRSGNRFERKISTIVRNAISESGDEFGQPFSISPESLPDIQLRRSLDFVVSVGGRPLVGIATVFQNQSGGRQQRDLSVTYPILQQKLAEFGMALVLIADGQGMKEASERSLVQLFEAVRHPMTMAQAQGGSLKKAFIEAAEQPIPETYDAAAIGRLISGALAVRPSVTASELPVANGPAVLALARYAETHKTLDLALSSSGDTLSWRRPEHIAQARSLQLIFNPSKALAVFAERLGTSAEDVEVDGATVRGTLLAPDTPPFAERLFVSANSAGLTVEATRNIGLQALEQAPGSSFAILLTERDLTETEVESHRKRQAILPVNIIVIGVSLLRSITESANPVRRLADAVLAQSDLTKVSPFVLSNATPTRMFFGRDAEAATVLGTLTTNSVALLGSRRIGKTSLLRRLKSDLEEANYLPYFGDCQTVKTWSDFAAMADQHWGVKSPQEFHPNNLGDLVRRLRNDSDKPVVILLDEIDQLLEWDRSHESDSVPEAFFRACRSLSQEGAAQFVFSGERTIAQRIWDPQSPHWNFCRPLQLAQLTREATVSLLVRPLRGMNIHIPNEMEFGSEIWRLTSGHPQIAQYLGDKLVRKLDDEDNRVELDLEKSDIVDVTESYEFAEHYLNTYWGQATKLEKSVTLAVINGDGSMGELLSSMRAENPDLSEEQILPALRMLQLYGIIEEGDGKIRLRAEWFTTALSYFGAASLSEGQGDA